MAGADVKIAGQSILLPPGGRTRTDVWSTPQWLFDALNREFGFTLDPCSDGANAKCRQHYTLLENGLRRDWGTETVFLNPPYSECLAWMQKAYGAAQLGATVVCLVPSRTDTEWWHAYAMKGRSGFCAGGCASVMPNRMRRFRAPWWCSGPRRLC